MGIISEKNPENTATDMSESIIIPLPWLRLWNWWFEPVRRTTIRIHFDPTQNIFWFTDSFMRILPNNRVENYGGAIVFEAKERLWKTHKTRETITRRVRKKTTEDTTAVKILPTAVINVVTSADGQVMVSVIEDATKKNSESGSISGTGSSVFRMPSDPTIPKVESDRHTKRISSSSSTIYRNPNNPPTSGSV